MVTLTQDKVKWCCRNISEALRKLVLKEKASQPRGRRTASPQGKLRKKHSSFGELKVPGVHLPGVSLRLGGETLEDQTTKGYY